MFRGVKEAKLVRLGIGRSGGGRVGSSVDMSGGGIVGPSVDRMHS